MYDYNYQYGTSYYKPQVFYIGEAIDPTTRRTRRRTMSPPGARTFSERWAANPFYGRYEPISEYYYKPAPILSASRFARASSIPADLGDYYSEPGRAYSRARSMTREASVARGQSIVTNTRESRARSMTRAQSVARTSRARSMTRARSVIDEEFEDAGSYRGGSVYGDYDNEGYYYDPLSDAEWERLLKVASKEERERSIFQMRMSLENPRELARKKMMQTTVGPGIYQSSLYGTETW
jgi:hypothetical protein